MSGLKIAVIGGGSSYTPELIDGIIKRSSELPVESIWLVDIQAGKEKLDIIGDLTKRMIKRAKLDIKVYTTLNRREAIKYADFVITQFRVGGLKARSLDEKLPLKYDVIGQETTGPGGFAKALRTIPVILDICNDIEELASNAWLINFTNPAGIITEAVLKHTNVKTIGLCNVPITMKNNISKILDANSNNIKIDFLGLNHMVYGNKVYLKGRDVTNKVLDIISEGESFTMRNIPDLKWDSKLIKSLEMIPCPYHKYYYMTDEILKEEKENSDTIGTRAKQVMDIEKKLFERYKESNLDTKPKELEKRGGSYYSDAAISLISAIYNDKDEIHTVNVKNEGAISNLSEDIVVEINCLINKSGAKPISVGKMSNRIKGLVEVVKSYELLTVESAVFGDYNKGVLGLSTNPLVPSFTVAKKIFDDIILANKYYLPQFK